MTIEDQPTRLAAALEVSEEILDSIEDSHLPFEQILLKCKRLARLRDDFDALNWFTTEISG